MTRRSFLLLHRLVFFLGLQVVTLASQAAPILSEAVCGPPAEALFEDSRETSASFRSRALGDSLSEIEHAVAAPFRNHGSAGPAIPEFFDPMSGSRSERRAGIGTRPGWNSPPLGSISSFLSSGSRASRFGALPLASAVGSDLLGLWSSVGSEATGIDDSFVVWPIGNYSDEEWSGPFPDHENEFEVPVRGRLETFDPRAGIPSVPELHYSYSTGESHAGAGYFAELHFEFPNPREGDWGKIPRPAPTPNGLGRHVVDVVEDPSVIVVPDVPEPAVWALLGLGLAALAVGYRRNRR